MRYSNQEKIEMIFIYGSREAIRIYQKRFPECICSLRSTHANIIKTFRETGCVDRKKCAKRKNP